MSEPIQTDALIIGAGPAGLFQAFQLGLLGVECQCVEALPHPGGQCAELYADKPIYDIPGQPCLRADELTERLLQQLQPFNTGFHYGHTIQSIETQPDGRLHASTQQGLRFDAAHIVIAAGVGAFSAVRIKLDELAPLGQQVFYNTLPDLPSDGRIVLCGDNERAVDTALAMVESGRQTTLLHRTRRLQAPDNKLQQLHDHHSANRLQMIKGKIIAATIDNDRLTAIEVQEKRGSSTFLPADYIVACLGTSPKLVAFDKWGLNSESNSQLAVAASSMQTSASKIYAVGDINHYPGKRKLILCAFHEATLAAFDIANSLQPDKPVHLQYTTTSTTLRQRLGVLEKA